MDPSSSTYATIFWIRLNLSSNCRNKVVKWKHIKVSIFFYHITIFTRGEILVYITLILWSNIGKVSNFYNMKQMINIAKDKNKIYEVKNGLLKLANIPITINNLSCGFINASWPIPMDTKKLGWNWLLFWNNWCLFYIMKKIKYGPIHLYTPNHSVAYVHMHIFNQSFLY